MPTKIHPKRGIHQKCPRKFTFYVHEKSATHCNTSLCLFPFWLLPKAFWKFATCIQNQIWSRGQANSFLIGPNFKIWNWRNDVVDCFLLGHQMALTLDISWKYKWITLCNWYKSGDKKTVRRKVQTLLIHSVLRLDATQKKRFDGKLFKFKKFSIK